MAEIKGQRIKALRRELYMTQDEMANKLDVSRQAIHSYENEKGNPEIPTLLKLAEILSCSVDYLLGLNDDRQSKIDEDDRADFDNAMKRHGKKHQKIAFLTFAKMLDSTRNYLTNPYLERPFLITMRLIDSLSEYNSFIQQMTDQEYVDKLTQDEVAKVYIANYEFLKVITKIVEDLSDIGIACISCSFPESYNYTKQIYGLRDSGLDYEESIELIKDMMSKKPTRKLGNKTENHSNT